MEISQIMGFLMMVAASVIFFYYSFWLMATPFLDQNDKIHQYFLPIEVAIYGPLGLFAVGVSGITGFLAKKQMDAQKKK